jgi:tetratricopeptide (TPR) repeat protein
LRDQIKAEYDRADPGDRDELQSRLTAAEARLADPDAALAKAQSRIADLEGILKRDRNHLLADRVSDAQDKLKLGDFSAVDLLFSQIVAGGEPTVQSVARAAFGRGEIAEQEIRWHDALGHFETAARLEDNNDHLAGLVRLLGLLGRTSEAVPLAKRLPKLTCDSFGTDSPEHGHLTQQASGIIPRSGAL